METSALLSEPLVNEPLDIFGDRILLKLSGADTDGNFTLMECVTQPQGGPPLHRHMREDECFYVLEGAFEFEVDGQRIPAQKGCSVYVPRGSAHAFLNVGDTPGKVLVMVQPAGLDECLAELSAATKGQPLNMSVAIPIFRKYGLELLGPPLAD